MALMQITIIPVGTESTSVGGYVADVEKMLCSEGIAHTLEDMGTLVEGDTNTLLDLARKIHNLPFQNGAKRVVTHITIDDRRDVARSIGEKKKSVYDRIGRENGI